MARLHLLVALLGLLLLCGQFVASGPMIGGGGGRGDQNDRDRNNPGRDNNGRERDGNGRDRDRNSRDRDGGNRDRDRDRDRNGRDRDRDRNDSGRGRNDPDRILIGEDDPQYDEDTNWSPRWTWCRCMPPPPRAMRMDL